MIRMEKREKEADRKAKKRKHKSSEERRNM